MANQDIQFYILKVSYAENIPDNLIYQYEDNELYISASSRLCGFHKKAHIENAQLAEAFKEYCINKFDGKYGSDLSLQVKGTNDGCRQISKFSLKRMAHDSEKITKVIAEFDRKSNK